MCIQLLDDTLRLILDEVLRNNKIARHGNSVVGLRRDDQAESLQVGGYRDLVLILRSGGKNLAKVDGTAFRCNGPQNISEVLCAEAIGGGQSFEISLDGCSSQAGLHFGLTLYRGQQARALKANLCGTVAMEVVDRRYVSPNYLNSIERHIVARSCRSHGHGVGLNGRLRVCQWVSFLRAYQA